MEFYGIILKLTIVALIIRTIFKKLTCGVCTCTTSMASKVVIVTGASSGIGRATATELARRGARVLLACRDVRKAQAVRACIVRDTGNTNVAVKHLDLASLTSVRQFAYDILKNERKLDVLINNAGMGILDSRLTQDRLPVEAQVNHFGPFLLTKLLVPLLRASAPSRVVVVASALHQAGELDAVEFVQPAEGVWRRMRLYSDTKLANMLFMHRLSRELRGTGVTANALNPSSCATGMFRDKFILVRLLIKISFRSPWQGAQTCIHLAVAPELQNVSGKYFEDCRLVSPANNAEDRHIADMLWTLSEIVTRDQAHVPRRRVARRRRRHAASASLNCAGTSTRTRTKCRSDWDYK